MSYFCEIGGRRRRGKEDTDATGINEGGGRECLVGERFQGDVGKVVLPIDFCGYFEAGKWEADGFNVDVSVRFLCCQYKGILRYLHSFHVFLAVFSLFFFVCFNILSQPLPFSLFLYVHALLFTFVALNLRLLLASSCLSTCFICIFCISYFYSYFFPSSPAPAITSLRSLDLHTKSSRE